MGLNLLVSGTHQAADKTFSDGFINYEFHGHKKKNCYRLRSLEIDPSLSRLECSPRY